MLNRKSLRRYVPVVIILAIAAIGLVFVGSRYFAKRIVDNAGIRSHIVVDDQRTGYTVLVGYDQSSSGFDWETHSIWNVTIVVRQSTTKDFKDVFREDFHRTWQAFNSRPPPTWTDRYVPSADFVLPSGRVLSDSEGQVYFVLFDGSDCSLYQMNTKTRSFDPCSRSPAIDRMLSDYYEHAFDPEDVYWDLALVKCADFFGKKPLRITYSPHAELDDIYTWWREIHWRSKPDVSP
jgi:hypothetical protein